MIVVVVAGGCCVEVDVDEPHAASGSTSRAQNKARRFMPPSSILLVVSLFAVVLLAAAVILLAVAEWPRIASTLGVDARKSRTRARRKSKLRVIEGEPDESDDFARSVERDLAALPTYDPHDADKRR